MAISDIYKIQPKKYKVQMKSSEIMYIMAIVLIVIASHTLSHFVRGASASSIKEMT